MYDVVIVGAGMAGMTAGIYVARAGKSVLVLESGAVGGQIVSALRVDNWPGDYGVSGANLALYKGKPVVVVGSGNTAKHEIKYLEEICSKVYHIHHDEPIPKEAEVVFVAIGRVPATGDGAVAASNVLGYLDK